MTGRAQSAPFSALGVSWLSDPQVDVAVQVRTRSGGRWSDWTEVDVQANSTGDDSPEARAARAGSDPLYVGPSDGVQVRVDAGATTPRDLQLALIDPGTSPADA
ncbi:MAG: N-acetylmuramoyl-L-alanine amidase, partial [Chloroflexota bacterium]|nr:N-acetylmuramoyl-L-alanine amidase [Chloroflexota bacterium]